MNSKNLYSFYLIRKSVYYITNCHYFKIMKLVQTLSKDTVYGNYSK